MTRARKVIEVRVYEIVRRAVAEGIGCGLNRAHKHTDAPTREVLVDALENAVMAEICEVLNLEPGE